MIEIPKQWKHWCRSARLRPHGRGSRRASSWLYLKGRGRCWRINDKGMFQCGDTYDQFDRWALCSIEQVPIPTTRASFLAAVNSLLAAKEQS